MFVSFAFVGSGALRPVPSSGALKKTNWHQSPRPELTPSAHAQGRK